MNIDLGSGELQLFPDRPLRLTKARGLGICCISGTIWITQTGILGDSFLAPGERLTIQNAGLSLIESIGEGRVRLELPTGKHWLTALQPMPKSLSQARRAECGINQTGLAASVPGFPA